MSSRYVNDEVLDYANLTNIIYLRIINYWSLIVFLWSNAGHVQLLECPVSREVTKVQNRVIRVQPKIVRKQYMHVLVDQHYVMWNSSGLIFDLWWALTTISLICADGDRFCETSNPKSWHEVTNGSTRPSIVSRLHQHYQHYICRLK